MFQYKENMQKKTQFRCFFRGSPTGCSLIPGSFFFFFDKFDVFAPPLPHGDDEKLNKRKTHPQKKCSPWFASVSVWMFFFLVQTGFNHDKKTICSFATLPHPHEREWNRRHPPSHEKVLREYRRITKKKNHSTTKKEHSFHFWSPSAAAATTGLAIGWWPLGNQWASVAVTSFPLESARPRYSALFHC